MTEYWNAIIKTPYMQVFTVFALKKDKENELMLTMVTEPFDMNITFSKVKKSGNILKAMGSDERGSEYELELSFEKASFSGFLSTPFMGKISINGTKGKGVTLADRLREYGEQFVDENRTWKGKWIWHKQQPETSGQMDHQLVLFRRTFRVYEGVEPTLKLDITADSRYRLYINGHSVSVGPCKGDQHVQYFETVDVSQYLRKGLNVLAVKVLRYPSLEPFKLGEGGPLSIWRSQSAGLFVEASLRDENNDELEALHSGPEWSTFRDLGYKHVAKPFIRWVGGTEEIDGKYSPKGWELLNYDDSSWDRAHAFADTRAISGNLSPWNLVPRPIPFLYETMKSFAGTTNIEGLDRNEAERILNEDNARELIIKPNEKAFIEIDAGELTTGYLSIGMFEGKGSIVRIIPSECYEPLDSNPARGRIKGKRDDTSGKLVGEADIYHVAGVGTNDHKEIYEPFLFRTFRYVRLEIETADEPLNIMYFHYRETGYPLEVKANFESSDDELNKIWDLSVRTLKKCMHETYEDCPYYEQLQYAMDSRLMMQFTYFLSADDRLARRTINDYYRSKLPSGMLQARYPSMQPQVIPSFALYWIDMIDEHYEFYKDVDLVKNYRSAIIELLDWYDTRLTKDGIVGITSNQYWTYFDWVKEWPMGAPPESIDRPMFLLSLMYANSLKKAAKLIKLTGWNEVAHELEKRAENICIAVRKLAWSEEQELFRDLPGTEIYSQHTQVMSVLAGVTTGNEARELLKRAMSRDIYQVSLPFSYLLIQALKKVGLDNEVFGLWDRWRTFISQGLTTLPEMELNPRSDCHAWSAVPLAEFPSIYLGVSAKEPGMSELLIEPNIDHLTWAKGSVMTKHGLVQVNWKIENKVFHLEVMLPIGVTAKVKLPDQKEHHLNGEGVFTSVLN